MTAGRLLVLLIVLGGLGFGGYYYLQRNPIEAPEVDAYTRADTLATSSKYDEAIAAYREALEADPNNPKAVEAYYRIAKCYEDAGRNREALEAYREFLRRYPNDPTRAPNAKERVALLETGV